MSRKIKNYTIVDRIGILTDTFTAATTDILTQSTHGLKNGDMVVLTTTDTLPAGLATSTVYWVIEATTNTFKLSATSVANYTTGQGGAGYQPIDVTDTGTGTHTYTMHDIGRSIDVSDFRHCIVAVHGNGSTDIDIGFVGSIGKSPTDDGCPDFSATQAYNNSWDYIEIYDLKTGTAIDGGATQIAQTGTAKHFLYEVNINGLKWLNILMSGWAAGGVTVLVRLFND